MAAPRILLATCAALPSGDEDDAALVDALREAGADPSWAIWDDPALDWSASELVLIRSTWDYTFRHAEFVQWAQRVPGLVNSAVLVQWSSDKRYLAQLAAHGVPIVPTAFAAPGEPIGLPAAGEFVVKPSIGAGSRGAARFDLDGPGGSAQRSAALAHAGSLHDAGRTVIVQPYLGRVDAAGETGMVFFGGVFSHAIRKAPMLAPGTANAVGGGTTTHDLFEPERITARAPSDPEHAVAQRVLSAVSEIMGDGSGPAGPPAYARVDLLPGPDGPVVIEVELVEPSLFLSFAPHASVLRFARELVAVAAAR